MQISLKLSDEYFEKIRLIVENSITTAAENDDDLILLKKEERNHLKRCLKSKQLNYACLKILRKLGYEKCGFYVHELFENGKVELPKLEPSPPPSEEYLLRIERLKAQMANRQYDEMTRDLAKGVIRPGTQKSDSIGLGEELKALNKFLVVFFNTVFTVAGAFFFAYKSLEYALPEQNFIGQLLFGCFVASIVFAADLYFILKSV